MGVQTPTFSRQQAMRQGVQTVGFTGLAVAGIVLTRVLLGLSFFFRDGVEKLHTWTTPKPLVISRASRKISAKSLGISRSKRAPSDSPSSNSIAK